MPEPDEFNSDSDNTPEIGDLAEAFIEQELDATLLDEIDRGDPEHLVDQADAIKADTADAGAYGAAVEVAELILDRIETKENRV